MKPHDNARLAVATLVAAALLCAPAGQAAPPADATTSVIVQAADPATATRLVAAVGGTVTHELDIIRAVGARPTASQRDRLAGLQGVLHLCAFPSTEAFFRSQAIAGTNLRVDRE